jgi:type IV pilus assembly protein PilA
MREILCMWAVLFVPLASMVNQVLGSEPTSQSDGDAAIARGAKEMRNRKQKGFSLIELLIVVAVILIIVAIGVPSYLAAVRTSHETAAAGNLKTMQSNANTYLGHQKVYPALAADMGGAEVGTTAAAACTADNEINTLQAAAWDAGFLANGYNYKFLAGGSTITSPLGCAGNSLWEVTAIPNAVSDGSVSYCADNTGEFEIANVGTVASGAGCKTDGYTVGVQ